MQDYRTSAVSRCPLTASVCWMVLGIASPVFAADLHFVEHPVDDSAEHNAAAAIDVNCDGKLDIVSGRFWYDLKAGQRHKVRDIEIIRGRYDDYSNLPVDVNHDGRVDIVSANYRSAKLLWIEQPADPNAEWITHVIAEPGPMETARLVDINRDGQLDVLPNGRDWAAWWEFRPSERADKPIYDWLRHELPKELAGHGIGYGDVNGDGRVDVIGPKGWAESPADAVKEEWQWHGEFALHRDSTVPILVFDVDSDGDSDVVWSRAHHTGIFWMEQGKNDAGRTWTRHVIDTTWSQCHTLEVADLDNDGRPEVVAGKRFMGHDGKDCGEWDPLFVCTYTFQPGTRTWRRQILASNTRASWDLDPEIADLDGDGDLDLICPGRSGLYWLENVPSEAKGPVTIAAADFARDDLKTAAMPYRDHRELLVISNGGNLRPITEPLQWGVRRSHLRSHMQIVMGRLPEPTQRVPLDIQTVSEEQGDGYLRRKITFASEPGDRVPAWLLLPPGALTAKPWSYPAMLCLHQTTKIGKDEPAGLGGLPNLHYAHELAKRGFICIVPDYPSFGEYPYDFKTTGKHYASGSMKAIWNNLRAVDVLEAIPAVDPDRMGVIGHSLGGHNALFTAVFDLRLNAVVSSCGFTPFHDYMGGKLAGWTSDRYMPRIRDIYRNDPDLVPFEFQEIVAALAPRAFFSNSPTGDDNFDIGGVKKAFAEARQVYDLLDVKADRLHVEIPEAGHDFPPDVREKAYKWLEGQLK
jgi:pimeloyl-ACP methyl ester carboxylesterase